MKIKKNHSSDIGVITMAYGNPRYFEQALNLLLSLKFNMPDLPVAIVTDFKNKKNIDLFDYVISLNPSFGLGVSNKVFLNKYSPFKETLFIDSDCIVTRPFNNELKDIRKFSFTPVCTLFLSETDSDDYIENMSFILKKLTVKKIPKFNGGVYFFKNNKKSDEIFSEAQQILSKYTDYGIRPFDKHGPNDETILSAALAKLGNFDLYNDSGNLMRPTINVSGEIKINPLGGGCQFRPWNELVAPAICHFVRNNVLDKYYLKCEYLLRKEFGLIKRIYGETFNSLKIIKAKLKFNAKMSFFSIKKKLTT